MFIPFFWKLLRMFGKAWVCNSIASVIKFKYRWSILYNESLASKLRSALCVKYTQDFIGWKKFKSSLTFLYWLHIEMKYFLKLH